MSDKCGYCGKEAAKTKLKIVFNGKKICFDCWIEDKHRRN